MVANTPAEGQKHPKQHNPVDLVNALSSTDLLINAADNNISIDWANTSSTTLTSASRFMFFNLPTIESHLKVASKSGNETYLCPTHGVISSSLTISINTTPETYLAIPASYCLHCLKDLLSRNLPEVQRV